MWREMDLSLDACAVLRPLFSALRVGVLSFGEAKENKTPRKGGTLPLSWFNTL